MGNQTSQEELQNAIEEGKVNDVKTLLAKGFDPNISFKNLPNRTLLALAAEKGHKDVVALLISKGANVNQATRVGSTPLFIAAATGHKDVVALLISKGANINQGDDTGWTPLYIAAQYGHKDVVALLISNGANVNYDTFFGSSPLFIAAQYGYKDVVVLLISNGAYVNHSGIEGRTPLYSAAAKGHGDVVSVLISNGANVNRASNNGMTPLHIAAENGHKEVVALLILNEANVNQTTRDGRTPLHYAVLSGHKDVVDLLISKGANVNQVVEKGATPLCISAKTGKEEITSLLISVGADVNLCSEDGFTPLHLAAESGNTKVTSILLQANADLDNKTYDGLTPLMIAIQNNHKDVIHLLNKAKQDLIIHAVKSGDASQLRELLKTFENVNIIDEDGNNLLHIAIQSNQPVTLNMLLELPTIQIDLYNEKKETPFTFAMKLRHRQMIKIIDAAINKNMQYIEINDLKYENNGFLGNGAFGAVYKGTYNNEKVAIKKIPMGRDNSNEFKGEINAMLQCRSPYLLHLIGVAELNTNEPKLVLQYMDGGDLRNHLDKLRNNEPTMTNYSTLEIAWAIANGLADIHHNNCVHRDLKSHNVLLSTKHYIKLADLGLTRDIASMMTQGVGTLYWTAPEVLKDVGGYGAPADIYSFGVVLTELDTLVLPYSNLQLSPFIIQNRVCDGSLRPALSGKCKPWYKNLVGRCLNDDPKLRPSASDIVAIIEKQFLKSDNDDEDVVVAESTELQPELESLNTSSRATTTSTSTANSKAPLAPQPLAATDIKCPTCKEPNSLLNEVCRNCHNALLNDAIKINILLNRLKIIHLEPRFICTVCQFENGIKSTKCASCQQDLVDADKVIQMVAQLKEAP